MCIKKNSAVLTLIIVAAIIVLSGGYYLAQKTGWLSKNGQVAVRPVQQNQVADKMADWKTYKNNRNGFEFRYPENWSIQEEQNNLLKENSRVIIYFGEGRVNLNNFEISLDLQEVDNSFFIDYVKSNKPISGEVGMSVSNSIISVDNREVVLQNYESTDIPRKIINYGVVIPMGKNTLFIKSQPSAKLILDQILTTLKFTDSADATADWKTYESQDLTISFQYPESFSQLDGSVVFLAKDKNGNSIEHKRIGMGEKLSKNWLESTIINDVVFDGSGLHPKSIDEFKKVKIGDYEFYKIRTGRFEGVLSYSYYLNNLIRRKGAFPGEPFYMAVFSFTSLGVDWTNQNLDEEADSTHVILKQMLATLKFTN